MLKLNSWQRLALSHPVALLVSPKLPGSALWAPQGLLCLHPSVQRQLREDSRHSQATSISPAPFQLSAPRARTQHPQDKTEREVSAVL